MKTLLLLFGVRKVERGAGDDVVYVPTIATMIIPCHTRFELLFKV